MQFALPLKSRGPTLSVPLTIDGQLIALGLRRHPRARRYVLRVTASADVVVTIPRWGSIAGARAFAGQHTDWIARERARRAVEAARAAEASHDVWLRGVRVPVEVESGVVRAGDVSARVADGVDPRAALRLALRETARRELPPRLYEFAAAQNLRVSRVTVRDQRTRWGSCSTRGVISLNWRLLLMPPDVRDYVLWHELMHLRRADHSRAFWKLVEGVCPDYQQARLWLRHHGRELHV